VLSFTADEIWQYLPGEREASAHLAEFPDFTASLLDSKLEERYQKILVLRSEVSKALERARVEKTIGHSLDAKVTLHLPAGPWQDLAQSYAGELATLFIVSQTALSDTPVAGFNGEEIAGLSIAVEKARGEKCERCWNYSTSIGDDSAHTSLCDRCCAALAAS
jgi:isoleucyl-tRNA synthetase